MKNDSAVLIKATLIFFSVLIFLLIHTTNSEARFGSPAIGLRADGADIYTKNCARCHGSDGRAHTAKGRQVEAADLTSSDWEPDEAKDIRTITKGKGQMPSFKRTLSAADIRAVVLYIQKFKR